jgi:hypothetical protein
VNHSSTPDACGERHAIGGHRCRRRGTSMLCDRHQRQRLLPSCRLCETFGKATDRCVWTLRTPPTWSHSPQCAECDHVGGRVWVRPVRRRRLPKDCGIERGRFRRMPDGDRRTRRETSQTPVAEAPPGAARRRCDAHRPPCRPRCSLRCARPESAPRRRQTGGRSYRHDGWLHA